MPSRAYTSVVFDFGGVLISPITSLLDDVAAWHGVTMGEMLDVLMGPREISTPDHPWHRAERGELPTAALPLEIGPFAEQAGIELRGDEYDYLLQGLFTLHDPVVDRIRRLRDEGYSIGLLTNSFTEFRPIIESRVDFGLFDVVIDSSEVGFRKPEPAIYGLTTAQMGGDPRSIVYLDDFLANVEGARREGWTTIHVVDVSEALAELDRLLG